MLPRDTLFNSQEIVKNYLRENNLGAWVSFRYESRRYLIGFTGSAGILVMKPEPNLLVDFRYTEQAKIESPSAKVIEFTKPYHKYLKEVLNSGSIKKVGFEPNHLTVSQLKELEEFIGEVEWLPTENLVENCRVIKDEQEISSIKTAQELSEKALYNILKLLKPGVKEIDLAIELEYQIRQRGANMAFPIIVASGERAALPHAQPTNKEIKTGEFIVIDFGARIDGYVSDCTRTFFLGKPGEKEVDVYNHVLEAQRQAFSIIQAGVEAGLVDKAARDYLKGKGLDNYFGHGLGHGVGLEVHEAPRVAIDDKTVLKEGMVITVEPGVYISGWGGVRTEDMVVLKSNGYYNLSKFPKDEWKL
ncbi:MAG: Aminopeptidase YpdF [candidate division WS2 bacterium]|uniref:Aminopeptidase YpdF n=1 Tax=Psychracetigena formicireducens TaxID=2986056 RepID=A0A9E2F0Z6_PSYF1|nr:Aminopeptidase YpdF [Candidatus Psychracetigena formicireducens]MBT9144222.1 Aminopeptidase YpdF [Candidatus Psychracetigena formicireducens]